jgi:hypothetical protein
MGKSLSPIKFIDPCTGELPQYEQIINKICYNNIMVKQRNPPDKLAAVGAKGWLTEECGHEFVTIYLVHTPSQGPTSPVETLPLLELPGFWCWMLWNDSQQWNQRSNTEVSTAMKKDILQQSTCIQQKRNCCGCLSLCQSYIREAIGHGSIRENDHYWWLLPSNKYTKT